MSSLTEATEAVLQPWFDYLLPPSLDYLPRALTKRLFDAFQGFVFAMEYCGEEVSNTEPLLEELFLWLGDEATHQTRRFLPSDVMFPAVILDGDQTFIPLAVRRLLRDPANLSRINKHMQRIVVAHRACLEFNPTETAKVREVRSAVQKHNRKQQKARINKDEVVRRLKASGWGKPGVSKKELAFDVAKSMGISVSSVRLAAPKRNDK